jgi:formylmethanofuran dehydrogenase subunit E
VPEVRKVVLHPIAQEDIFTIPKGTKCGENTAKKDGFFLSGDYVREVLDVGIEGP